MVMENPNYSGYRSSKEIAASNKQDEARFIVPDDVFEEFLIWSFTSLKDLHSTSISKKNLMKLHKKAPRTAKMLVENINVLSELNKRRKEKIQQLEKEAKDFPTCILLKSLKKHHFKSNGERIDFGQKLQATIRKRAKKLKNMGDIISMYQLVFDDMVEKFSNKRDISIVDCRFYKISKDAFQNEFEQESEILQIFMQFQERVHPSSNYMTLELIMSMANQMQIHSCNRVKQKCFECQEENVQEKEVICSGCQVAVYCSPKCQKKNWFKGHNKKCKELGQIWSTYTTNKKHIQKAIEDERVWTEDINIDGKSCKCVLRPSPGIDSDVSGSVENLETCSIKTLYRNLATIACGGKHLIFGEETLRPSLRNQPTLELMTNFISWETKQKYAGILTDFILALASNTSSWTNSSVKTLRKQINDRHGYGGSLNLQNFLLLYTSHNRTDPDYTFSDHLILFELMTHNLCATHSLKNKAIQQPM